MRYKDMLRISESSAYIIFRSSSYIKTFGSQLRPEDQQIGYASVTKYRYWRMVHFALKGYVAVCFVYVVVMACIERLCCCVFCLCSSPPGLQRTTWHLLKGYVAVCFVYVVVMACIKRLCCCVFCLCSSPPGLRRTTWHVSDTSAEMDQQRDSVTQRQSVLDNTDAQQLLTVAANRVWEELYVCKKPVGTQS